MFNNLKAKVTKDSCGNKIEENDKSAIKNESSSLIRTQSIESLNSNPASENRSKRKDEIIKKWENKVSNLITTVRDKNAKICELESQIANDKSEFERKLSEIKESSALNVQSLLDEHRLQVQQLEQGLTTPQDRDKCQKKWQESQNQVENFRIQRFSVDEENESLGDLTKQELAKVKHMLILRENDYGVLQLKEEELKRKLERLEVINGSLTSDLEKKQSDLIRITKQREIDLDERRSQQTTIRGLLTDKDNLEIKLDDCQEKLSKTELLLMNVERSSADLHSKLQQITRDHDQLKLKHNRLESEKEDRESDLKDRIRSLENHLAVIRESEVIDERVNFLEEKCSRLESRNMEEKVLKDNLLKSWSDRVDHLEAQIANLNNKISEDSEEITNYNQVKSNIIEKFEKQIVDLKQDIIEYEKKISLLQEEIDEKSNIFIDERNKWELQEDKLRSQFQSKMLEATNLSQENTDLKKELKKNNEVLSSSQTELRNKTHQIQKLEDEMKKIKVELEDKSDEISGLMSERFKRELKLTELNSKVTSLESDKTELTKSASQMDTDFKSLHLQFKKSTDDKAEMSRKLDFINEQFHNLKIECDHRIKTMQTEVESRTRELDISHANVKELHDQIRELESEKETVIIGMESIEVLKLKNEMELLNAHVLDKNKIIRNQKQQISDLRKTLDKEIRINNGSQKWLNYDEISLGSRNDSSNQLTSSDNYLDGNRCSSTIFNLSNNEAGSSSGDDAPVVVNKNGFIIMDQINFKYLKHVLVKFLVSKDSEALQLVKAVSTLLRLTPNEELSIKKSIESRNSWFNRSKSKSSKSVQEQLKRSRFSRPQQPS